MNESLPLMKFAAEPAAWVFFTVSMIFATIAWQMSRMSEAAFRPVQQFALLLVVQYSLFAMAFFNAPATELRYQPSLVCVAIIFPVIRLRAFRGFFGLIEHRKLCIILPLCFGLSLQLLPLAFPDNRLLLYVTIVLPDMLLNIYLSSLLIRKGGEMALFGHSLAAFAITSILLVEITVFILIAAGKGIEMLPDFTIVVLGVLEATSMLIMTFGRLIGQLTLANRQLHDLAIKDPLTGLLNRRAFSEQGNIAFAAGKRYRKPVSMMMLDIDWFKKINDRYGHAGGDEALRVFSALLKKHARSADVIGRLGGEEFAIIMPDTDMAGGRQLAERLRSEVEKVQIATDAGSFTMSTSIGVDLLRPDDDDLFAMLSRADQALYAAKETGRNRVVGFGD